MRQGYCNARLKRNTPQPPAPLITLCICTHSDPQDKYYRGHEQILKLSWDSMMEGTRKHRHDIETSLWCNGGAPEYRAFCRSLNPTTYIETINVGPHYARKYQTEMARGQIVMIADDDVLYSPDWLERQLEILDTYPNVGLVSGSPQHHAFAPDGSCEPTWEWARKEPRVRKWIGRDLIPEQWTQDWAVSIGAKPDAYKGSPAIAFDQMLLEYKGVKAWAHGHHLQFLARRDVILPHFTLPKTIIDLDNFNIRIGQAGLYQFCTFKRTAVHIGNVIDESIQRIAAAWKRAEPEPIIRGVNDL
jgi:glycosyltransferase involved in cell wall biosynthesis